MSEQSRAQRIEESLATLPVLDAHTHLAGGKLAARGLHDVLLYHMSISDLYSAGCPSGARLSEFPKWTDKAKAHRRIVEAIPYLEHIRGTSSFWAVRIILADLYNWHEQITANNWRKLDDMIRERSDDRVWQRTILDRSNIRRTCAEYGRRDQGQDDDRLQYSLEWGMFMRCQWGEYDTALYELERAWGRPPEQPSAIGVGKRAPTQRVIRSMSDIHAALDHYVSVIPYKQVISTAMHLSTDIDYTLPSEAEIEQAITRRSQAASRERDVYAAYVAEEFFKRLEKWSDQIVFQFSIGAEPLPFETCSRIGQRTITQLGEMLARHPRLRFQAFNASEHADQSLCTLCRELPNFSLAGYWWHNFFPQTIRNVFSRRLDMVALNKQVGFFSDAYCVEWCYAKWKIVRTQMAQVLATKVEQGQFTEADAVSVAATTLFDTPRDLLGMIPIQSNSI